MAVRFPFESSSDSAARSFFWRCLIVLVNRLILLSFPVFDRDPTVDAIVGMELDPDEIEAWEPDLDVIKSSKPDPDADELELEEIKLEIDTNEVEDDKLDTDTDELEDIKLILKLEEFEDSVLDKGVVELKEVDKEIVASELIDPVLPGSVKGAVLSWSRRIDDFLLLVASISLVWKGLRESLVGRIM